MVKMIRGWKTMGTRVLLQGKQGYICTYHVSCIYTHLRKIRVDDHITLILQFAQGTCIDVGPKSATKGTYNTYGE